MESSRGREPGDLLGTWPCSLRFCGNGVRFWIVSGPLSCSAHTWSGPGSFLVACVSLSQGSWEVGGLLPPTGPSQILQFSLQGSTPFLIRASGCETSRESDDYRLPCLAKVGGFSLEHISTEHQSHMHREPRECSAHLRGWRTKRNNVCESILRAVKWEFPSRLSG